jgi:anti-sigma regulatory factor (Ser/Thr protein kinase)
MVLARREYTSDLSQLGEMRAFLREACQKAWGPDDLGEPFHLLELALGEAATNVMLHAYDRRGGQPIEMVVEVDCKGVTVWLYHNGRNFDPFDVPPPVFDGSKESGFGLYLIRQAVDEVQYFHDERGRCGIRLFKKHEPNSKRA